MSEQIELRAERLRVLIAGMGEEPMMNIEDTFASGVSPAARRLGCLRDLAESALSTLAGSFRRPKG